MGILTRKHFNLHVSSNYLWFYNLKCAFACLAGCFVWCTWGQSARPAQWRRLRSALSYPEEERAPVLTSALIKFIIKRILITRPVHNLRAVPRFPGAHHKNFSWAHFFLEKPHTPPGSPRPSVRRLWPCQGATACPQKKWHAERMRRRGNATPAFCQKQAAGVSGGGGQETLIDAQVTKDPSTLFIMAST